MHVRIAVQEFLASRRRSHPRVRMDYAQLLNAFSTWCEAEDISLEAIRASHIDSFIEYMVSTRKPKKPGRTTLSTHTLDKYITILKTFLKWASEDDEFEEFVKPTLPRKLKPQRVEEYVREVFSKAQIEALFKSCDAEKRETIRLRDRAIIAVLLDSGVRNSELCLSSTQNPDHYKRGR